MIPALLTAALLVAAPKGPARPPAAAPEPPAAADLLDAEPTQYTFQLGSSPRFAPPVKVRLDDAWPKEALPVRPLSGAGAQEGWSWAPTQAAKKYTLAVARRHFESAAWTGGRDRGRELVLKGAVVQVSPGPYYQVQVTVDRYEDGRRLGQAQGTGSAQADRTADRTKAAFVPGPWGAAAVQDTLRAKPDEDAAVIAQATLRALDHAFMQLGLAWGVAGAPVPARAAPSAVAPPGPDATAVAGPTATVQLVNGTSLPLCDVRIWKDARPGHTDQAYNFIRGERVHGGQVKWLLDGVPSTRYHVTVASCDGTEVLRKDVDLKAGENKLLVK